MFVSANMARCYKAEYIPYPMLLLPDKLALRVAIAGQACSVTAQLGLHEEQVHCFITLKKENGFVTSVGTIFSAHPIL